MSWPATQPVMVMGVEEGRPALCPPGDLSTGSEMFINMPPPPEGAKTIGYQKWAWVPPNVLSIGEIYTLPSLTIPDEGLTVPQILNNFTTGMPLKSREPVYNGDEFIPDFLNMDLADREEYLEQVKETVLSKTEELKALQMQQQVARKKAKELAEELAAQAMAERLNRQTPPPTS